jgi:hypothetical protein
MCEEYVCDHMQRIALHLSTAKREPSDQAERNFGDTRSFQSLYHIAFDLQAASITERNPDEQRTVFFLEHGPTDRTGWYYWFDRTNFLSSTGWQWGRPVVEVDAIDGAVDIIFL